MRPSCIITALLLLLFIVLLAALFVCIEIVGLFVYCERGWPEGEPDRMGIS
mgnify:CR=1 FL=1